MKNFKLSNGITHIPLELPWTSPGFVNVYLIEDSDGYIMIDCGVNGEKYFSLLKNYLMEEKIELNEDKVIVVDSPSEESEKNYLAKVTGLTL